MDALEVLVSMGIAPVLVSKSVAGKILVNFENGYIRDGCFFRGAYGSGSTVQEAAKDYASLILGQRVVLHPNTSAQKEFYVGGWCAQLLSCDSLQPPESTSH